MNNEIIISGRSEQIKRVDNMELEEGKSTMFCVVLSDRKTNGRNILYKKGTASDPEITSSDLQMIRNARYLHIAGWKDIHMQAAKHAKEHGVITVLDADTYSPGMDEILPYIDVLIASEFVYQHYYKDLHYEKNLKDFMQKGPETVIVTLGGDGCVGISGDGYFKLPAFSVEVRDTVGAGDVFHGAYIYGLCQSWRAKECARFASAVSAIKCTRLGGRAAIPTVEMTKQFLETGVIDFEQLKMRVKYYERGIEHVR